MSRPVDAVEISPYNNDYQFDRALASLWAVVDQVNRSIQAVAPWALSKRGRRAELHGHLDAWVQSLYQVGYWLEPFLPRAAGQIRAALLQRPIVAAPVLFPPVE